MALKERVRPEQVDKGPRCCGQYAIDERLAVVAKDGQAYVGGIMVCGRAWVCPTCARRVGQHRAGEVAEALTAHLDAGGGVYLVTLTVRHNRGQDLVDVLGAVNKARSAMVRCRRWQTMADTISLVGMIRSVEITCSEQGGWHPHEHALVLTERPLDPRAHMLWWVELADLWAHQVTRADPLMAPAGQPGVGVDLKPVLPESAERVAAYVTNEGLAGAALEVSRPDAKGGRGESMTPWQLADRAAGGDKWARSQWREYCTATRGVHRIRWTRGLRARLRLGQELTDQEAAEDTDGCEPVTQLDDRETALVLAAPELAARVCEAAEHGGATAVHEYLARCLAELGWRERVTLRRWAKGRTGRGRSPGGPPRDFPHAA